MALESSWVDRLYSHFLGRDLAYAAAGFVPLWAVQKTWFPDKKFIPEGSWSDAYTAVWVVGFTLACYLTGLVLSESAAMVGVDTRLRGEKRFDHYRRIGRLQEPLFSLLVKKHERTVFLMTIASALFASSAVSSLVFLTGILCFRWALYVPWCLVAGFISAASAAGLSGYVFRRKRKHANEEREELANFAVG